MTMQGLSTPLFQQRDKDARNVRVAYLAPGAVELGAATDPHKAADFAMTKAIGEVLARHYPRIPWGVRVDSAQGVAMIQVAHLMGATGHYVIHLSKLAVDPGFKSVIRAGGEILERFGISRSRSADDEAGFKEALMTKRIRGANDPFPE